MDSPIETMWPKIGETTNVQNTNESKIVSFSGLTESCPDQLISNDDTQLVRVCSSPTNSKTTKRM